MALTEAEKRNVRLRGFSVSFLPDSGIPQGTYHDPATGQEFHSLPTDAVNLKTYMGRGLLPGPASEELRERWAEAQRTYRGPEQDYLDEARCDLRGQGLTGGDTSALAEEVRELKEMVAALLNERRGFVTTPAAEAREPPPEPVQLRLL